MDDLGRTKANTPSGSGIGFLVAAAVVVLVLLYALFAGGGSDTSVDPAAVGATDQGAPVLEETAPAQPAAPGVDE